MDHTYAERSRSGRGELKLAYIRHNFAGVLAIISFVVFIVAMVTGTFGLTLFGVSASTYFYAGCLLLVGALIFRPRRARR
jgi:hypothetical protein